MISVPRRDEPALRILFVHGVQPKPPPDVYAALLWRSLLAGVERRDPSWADTLRAQPGVFELVYWAELFYGETRDARQQERAVADALAYVQGRRGARERLRALRLALLRSVYRAGDRYPALVPWIGTAGIKRTLQHVGPYFHDRDGVGARLRARLKDALARAWSDGRRVLLIGHSLGSVIAWDALWELSHREPAAGRVELLLTLGSPLGTRWVQRRLLGAGEPVARRFPKLVDRWINIRSAGDMTAFRPALAGDLAALRGTGLATGLATGQVPRVEERSGVKTWFLDEGRVNVHEAYGYLMNRDVGDAIVEWLADGPP